MFFTTKELGRVYVIRMVLPCGTTVHKVGMTNSNRATDRLFELLRSWFNSFRYVPYARLRLDHECHNPSKIEAYIHKVLSRCRYNPEFPVQGHTEMFIGVNEVSLIHFIKNTDTIPEELSKEQYKVLGTLLKVWGD